MNDHNRNSQPSDEALEPADRVDELLSLFFDDSLNDQQVVELNELLLSDPEARARSVDAAQLHADLHAFFNEKKEGEKPTIAPALKLQLGGLGLPTTG